MRVAVTVTNPGGSGLDDLYIKRVPDGGLTVAMLGLALAGTGMLRRRWSR